MGQGGQGVERWETRAGGEGQPASRALGPWRGRGAGCGVGAGRGVGAGAGGLAREAVTRRPAGAAAGVSPGTRAGASCPSASSSASACTRSRGRWRAAGGRSLETKRENIQESGEGELLHGH